MVFLLTAGYGEQLFGQFTRHHHERAVQSCAVENGEVGVHQDHDEDSRESGESGCLEHMNVIGMLQQPTAALIVNRRQVGIVAAGAASRVEAPVRGIDYPPQLS